MVSTITTESERAAGGGSRGAMAVIPASHRDLIDGPYWAALTTVMPDGQPQVTPVWCDREGGYVLTNTMKGFRKEKNMRANPHVTVLVYDPLNPQRNIEVRGLVAELTEEGAIEHNDRLAQLYLGKPDAHFFGDCVPAELAQQYVRIKVVIAPTHVRVGDPVPLASVGASSGLPPAVWLGKEAGAGALPLFIPPPSPPVPLVSLPESHRDLFTRPVHGVLSTMMPEGQPQSSLVWVDYDGSYILICTALGRRKCRNMQANPKVTLLVVDPNNTSRWIEVRGRVAEITTEGAIAHADMLAQRYTGKEHFYGGVYEGEWQQYETRVIVKIAPVRVALDAIFR